MLWWLILSIKFFLCHVFFISVKKGENGNYLNWREIGPFIYIYIYIYLYAWVGSNFSGFKLVAFLVVVSCCRCGCGGLG